MKAASPVLPQTQRPLTILGMPPMLFVLSTMAGGVVFSLMVVLSQVVSPLLMPLSMVLGVGIIVGCCVYFWRRSRTDHHLDRVLLKSPLFWRAKPTRTLIAGVGR